MLDNSEHNKYGEKPCTFTTKPITEMQHSNENGLTNNMTDR